MTVKELMEKLAKCNPNAKVCVGAWAEPEAQEVLECIIDDIPCVYIGDDFENLEYELGLYDEEE